MHIRYFLLSSFFPLLFIFENLFMLYTSQGCSSNQKVTHGKGFRKWEHLSYALQTYVFKRGMSLWNFLHEYCCTYKVMNNFHMLNFSFWCNWMMLAYILLRIKLNICIIEYFIKINELYFVIFISDLIYSNSFILKLVTRNLTN